MIPQLMTIEQVAEALAVPVRTLRHWRAAGRGPCAIRIGKHLRYSEVEVARWLGRQAADGQRAPGTGSVVTRRVANRNVAGSGE